MIEDLISQILQDATNRTFVRLWPGTEANADAIAQWERTHGYVFPDEYKQFLKIVGRCELHGSKKEDRSFAVRLFSLQEISTFSKSAFGNSSKEEIPSSWYTIADAQDGNFIVMDLASVDGRNVNIIDGCWEYGPDQAIISRSFEEFLRCSISDRDTSSGGGNVHTGARYWSKPGHYYGQSKKA